MNGLANIQMVRISIDILIVHLKKETSIERARSMQRNFIAGICRASMAETVIKMLHWWHLSHPITMIGDFRWSSMEYNLEETPKVG